METKEMNTQRQILDTPQKIVYSKLDFSWYLAGTYLDILRGIGAFSCDKEFSRLFTELRDYVDKRFLSQFEGEINDIFVIAEQIIPTNEIK
ncbi:MAG: hypothetical protein K2J01_03985 [Clostridiales bacterium]|nr:hypothetical protein [Clostridiales bacterium]